MAVQVSSAQAMAARRCVPTYSTAERRPHHIVVLELEILVKDSRVELYFAVELVADLLPVRCWLGHGYRDIMARLKVGMLCLNEAGCCRAVCAGALASAEAARHHT